MAASSLHLPPLSPGGPGRSFPGRTTLTRGDRRVLGAIAEAMFSQDGEVERSALDAHLDEVDAFISSASKMLRVGLRLALFVVRVAPILFFFRLRLIEQLSLDDRVAILTRLERSSIANLSLAFIGWRTVMTLVFYESAKELKSLGYAGDAGRVYKRHLATFAPTPVPVPEESGIRLRHPDARDSEPAVELGVTAESDTHSREVA